MKQKHIILTACVALFSATQAIAQGEDLSILTANNDARTAAMGNASTAAGNLYLYNNPAAIFKTDKSFTADAATSFFEGTEGADGTFGLYAATAGYKFAKHHAIFGGLRYAGGLKIKGYDVSGNPTKDYEPYNWTLDLGYAIALGKGFAAYASTSLIYSHLSKNATSARVSVGGSYQNNVMNITNRHAELIVNAKVDAFGPKLNYGNNRKGTLPTFLSVGGELTVDMAEKHQVAAALSTHYFLQSSENKLFMIGGGLEYTYNKLVSVRTGYEYGNHYNSHITMGAGVMCHGLRLNGAYNLKTTDTGSNYCSIGIGYDF